jgi:hypothetical protein
MCCSIFLGLKNPDVVSSAKAAIDSNGLQKETSCYLSTVWQIKFEISTQAPSRRSAS